MYVKAFSCNIMVVDVLYAILLSPDLRTVDHWHPFSLSSKHAHLCSSSKETMCEHIHKSKKPNLGTLLAVNGNRCLFWAHFYFAISPAYL